MEIYQNLSLEDLPNEEWRFIPNTDDLYMISSLGRVKSVDSVRKFRNGLKTYKGRIRKQFPNWQGYLSCYVTNRNLDKIPVRVHKVVCDVFIPNPYNLPCVNHKNEIKWDNRVENLEHCTYSYNLTYGSREGEKDVQVLQYDLNGNYIKEFKSVKLASKEVGVEPRCISNVIHGWSRSAGGYIWKLKTDNIQTKIKPHIDNNKRKVLCYDLNGNLIGEYPSLICAEKTLGIHYQSISDCCRGKVKKVKNLIFKYK